MSKFENNKIMPRYTLVVILMALLAVAVVGKAGYIMTAKRSYWMDVAERVKRDSVDIKPTRGNILSCDGQILASSLPEFKLFVDFNTLNKNIPDSLWNAKEDSICQGLHQIFPSRSAEEFCAILREGKKKIITTKEGVVLNGDTRCTIWPKRVNYATYSEVRTLPIFSMSRFKSGLYWEEYNSRVRPTGSLASRTVGEMFGAKDTARCGLELSYDSLLRGEKGLMHRRKVLNKFLSIVDVPATNGADLVTTIDVNMQDIAERALLKELRLPEVNGEMGVAILMEVKTGDIKAIVNLTKCAPDGEYREIINSAINYRCEPGSVFKPASIMVALDDEKCDTGTVIHTGGGVMEMHSRLMKDHNWATQGGYGDINVARSLEVSSNIGVSWIIDHNYAKEPEKYLEGLKRIGMGTDLQIPLVGYNPPILRNFKRNPSGGVEDKTQLPWMSIGYGTQIAPINTVTFYNAIANGGKMVKPRFVKAVVKNGEVIQEFPTEVLIPQICKPTTLAKMQTMLRHVVSQGLGKKAGSKKFQVSGKTGTAQVSQGSAGYKSGTTGYWLSFAGYFPSDNPRYSCIVCIKKWGLPASGGGMSGVVFHEIAEGVMANALRLDVKDAHDAESESLPGVKRGNILAADYVLQNLGFQCRSDWDGSYASGNPIWGTSEVKNNASVSLNREKQYGKTFVPDVTGMGARDAVYILESRGMKVRLSGRGKVYAQSVKAGSKIQKGQVCQLSLDVADMPKKEIKYETD